MANPRIEVEIGANVAGLTAGVNTATGQLNNLGKAAQTTAPQIQKLTQATSGYNSIGTDFARIIQDAPFGIIGVGNNITQLAGSFQTLKNTTGSTKAALTQAFSSIFSSGNALILGIFIIFLKSQF
jgi:predicted PurR-regulated permease PerM